ncbi:MAG: DoxX-like family protein [Psychrosphaera sp.]|nr:DoxX-like family protein [Psychrosphaera sp.]
MLNNLQLSTTQIARFILGFSWLYQGIFPKLVHIAPLEKAMTASIGLPDDISYWITKSAGVGEVVFGLMLLYFYQSRWVHLLNIMAMIGLLLFVAILLPHVLFEAFNPVTTNIALIGFSLILIAQQNHKQSQDK